MHNQLTVTYPPHGNDNICEYDPLDVATPIKTVADEASSYLPGNNTVCDYDPLNPMSLEDY